jgi:hypothetical protein
VAASADVESSTCVLNYSHQRIPLPPLVAHCRISTWLHERWIRLTSAQSEQGVEEAVDDEVCCILPYKDPSQSRLTHVT